MTEAQNKPDLGIAEARNLGRELARVYKKTVEKYQGFAQIPLEETIARTDELLSGISLEEEMEQDPQETSWLDLDSLANAGESLQAWERIKEEARKELSLGGTVARLLVSDDAKPWEHAQFYALRQGLIDEWQPRGGMELALLDTLASSLLMHRFRLQQHVFRVTTRAELQKRDVMETGKRRSALSWELEDTERAADMADRFHRMAVRTLRALRDVRRYSPAVSIRSAGQVNIGETRVNVGRTEP